MLKSNTIIWTQEATGSYSLYCCSSHDLHHSLCLFVFRVLPQLWGDVHGNGQHPCHQEQLPGSEDCLQSDSGSRKVRRSVWPFSLSGSGFICASLSLRLYWLLHLTVRLHHTEMGTLPQSSPIPAGLASCLSVHTECVSMFTSVCFYQLCVFD